jgi:putative DNA primase/helicase
MIRLAKSETCTPLKPEDLDRDPWLFNVKNGTLNLKTGELYPFDQQRMISKQSPVLYKKEVAYPTWEYILKTIFPKEEMILFLQKAIG